MRRDTPLGRRLEEKTVGVSKLALCELSGDCVPEKPLDYRRTVMKLFRKLLSLHGDMPAETPLNKTYGRMIRKFEEDTATNHLPQTEVELLAIDRLIENTFHIVSRQIRQADSNQSLSERPSKEVEEVEAGWKRGCKEENAIAAVEVQVRSEREKRIREENCWVTYDLCNGLRRHHRKGPDLYLQKRCSSLRSGGRWR